MVDLLPEARELDSIRSDPAEAARYGFGSVAELALAVGVKRAIADGDVERLRGLVAGRPEVAGGGMSSRFAGSTGACLLNYLGAARFHGILDHDRVGGVARVLLAAGAPADGPADVRETPLITAASYGEVELARVLVDAGADLRAVGYAVAGGTALAHAVEYGNTDVADLLVAAGAEPAGVVEAAGAGDLGPVREQWSDATAAQRVLALRAAAVNGRSAVVDWVVSNGVAVDDSVDGSGQTALHWAAWHGKPESVAHLLALGADPGRTEAEFGGTPLAWCRHRRAQVEVYRASAGHAAVEAVLLSLADPDVT
ncbi:ankyrin repeat domain-containing protein [Actinosynnema sp. NPDC047251]|nr:ankyrin repeat domain-containing protein [Saccharothrix espanaensis]